MAQAIAETLRIVEIRTKIQFLTFETESTQVLRLPSVDA